MNVAVRNAGKHACEHHPPSSLYEVSPPATSALVGSVEDDSMGSRTVAFLTIAVVFGINVGGAGAVALQETLQT